MAIAKRHETKSGAYLGARRRGLEAPPVSERGVWQVEKKAGAMLANRSDLPTAAEPIYYAHCSRAVHGGN
ncbi:hypothetical protein KC360_g198 [Hortaea werneckii]|nr:hypothetical protein KC344_g202 [Hortaea werneckii]KAI7180570.1 hypothetical protein KC360_g198 [Hortaea werneckii]